MQRRRFLSTAFLGASATQILGAPQVLNVLGADAPSERVRVGVLGLRNRGKSLAGGFAGLSSSEVAAICDVDRSMIAPALASISSKQNSKPKVHSDDRAVFDDKGIDAVVVATPDHWHAIQSIHACRADKDVYVEKPACHNLVEGHRMIETARRTKRVVQVGTQRRSQRLMREACEYVRSGQLGRVGMARCWSTSARPNIGRVSEEAVPKSLDWDRWLGPAPKHAYRANRCHYHWRWYWDTGTGEIGNNGVHFLDIARWGLGVASPSFVSNGGGKFVHDDDRETPDTQICHFEFPEGKLLTWEHRIWTRRGIDGLGAGIEFYGDRGTLLLRDQVWEVFPANGKPATHRGPSGWREHLADFLGAVKTRSRPSADIETGVRSTELCLLGNVAHRSRASLRVNPEKHEVIEPDDEIKPFIGRTYRSGFELPL